MDSETLQQCKTCGIIRDKITINTDKINRIEKSVRRLDGEIEKILNTLSKKEDGDNVEYPFANEPEKFRRSCD